MKRSVWQYGMFAAVAGVAGISALIAVRSYFRESAEFFPRRRLSDTSVAAAGVPGLASIAFADAMGAVLSGWYAPSTNGAGIVLLHGAGGDRASLLPEARDLASRGFGVLLFDWPGHGESEGEIHWNDGEARALVAALDFLSQRSDLDVTRLGALGFSMGGAVLARVAPTQPRIGAAVFVGTPADQAKQIEWENRRFGLLSQLPSLWAILRGGAPVYENQPVDRIGAITPRPVLIVAGSDDQVVPESQAHDLFAAAHDPKELLVVDGAGHGEFYLPPGSTYLDRLAHFFEQSLLGPRA